jgi:hypothetical protein
VLLKNWNRWSIHFRFRTARTIDSSVAWLHHLPSALRALTNPWLQPPHSRGALTISAKEQKQILFERLQFHLTSNLYGEEKPMPTNHRLGVAEGKDTQLLARAPSCLRVLRSGEQAEAVFHGQGQFCTSVKLEKRQTLRILTIYCYFDRKFRIN